MKTQNYLNIKTKSYYAGVALVALMSVSSPSQAMEVPQEMEPKDNKISRVRCLWNLEKKPSKNKVYRAAALEILEKKAIHEQADPKIRLSYIKKLGQFLKDHPQHLLNLEMMKPAKENEETPLSKFYQGTLAHIEQSSFSPAEKALQTFKLKIFYSHLPQELTKMDIQKHQKDINQSFNKVQLIRGVDGNNLRYLKSYYFDSPSNIKELEKLTTVTVGTLLGGKINFKLGLNILEDDHVCGTSAKAAYYETAINTPYSLVKYHLAELYNIPSSEAAGFYLPQSAYELYANIVKDGDVNPQGKPLAAYPLAAYKLAKLLETGNNAFDLLADKEAALYWHTQAARHGHPYAQYELAKHYMATQKEAEAIELLHQAAESGYSKAQFELAQKYEQGYGNIIKKNPDLALFWYHRAAEQEEGEAANYPLGYAYEIGNNYEKAIFFYEKSKDPRGDVRLGKMYLEGTGKEKSERLALDHFQKAASQNNADGNYCLGLMKLKGQGFQKPMLEDAFDNFSIAAKQNHSEALLQLGIMKQFGIGTKQSYTETKTYYEKAHTPAALYHLGNLYKRGLGVEQNINEALKLWREAADSGHIEAAYKAGKAYLKAWCGLGRSEKNLADNAYNSVKKAADLKHIDALYLFGLIQAQGIGCEQNPTEATKLYIEAADAGHADAQFKLAQFYHNIPDSNKIKILRYYELAAAQNHVGALRALSEIYRDGDIVSENSARSFFYIISKRETEIDTKDFNDLKKLVEMRKDQSSISWFKKMAEEGKPRAQYYFAKLLEEGVKKGGEVLLPQCIQDAIDYYRKAADNGWRSAKRRLNDLKQIHLLEALDIKKTLEDSSALSPSFIDEQGTRLFAFIKEESVFPEITIDLKNSSNERK